MSPRSLRWSTCVVVLLLAAATVFAAGQKDAGAAAGPKKKAPPYVVGLSNVGPVNPWKVAMEEEFKNAAAKMPNLIKQYYVTDAGNQIAKQIADVEDLMAKGVDLLMITAISPSALSPVCEKAVERGIVVVSFDNVVDTPKVTLKVQADEEALGGGLMEWLCKKINGKGKIVMLGGIAGNSTAVLRWKGGEDVLKKYPDVKVVGTAYTNWAFDKAKAAMESFLSANPVIDGVWTDGGASGQGALTACVEANRVVPLTGTASNGFLKLWKSLKPKGFSSYTVTHPAYCSVPALEYGLKILQGEKLPPVLPSKLEIIDESNMESFVRENVSDAFWVQTRLPEETITRLWGLKK